MIRVLIESPFTGKGDSEKERLKNRELNIEYARSCLNDSLMKGEAPYASHLLYTQKGILDDDLPEERTLGIEAGLIWGSQAEKTVVYLDRGLSKGMVFGVERALKENREIEFRLHPDYITSSTSLLLKYLTFVSDRKWDGLLADPIKNSEIWTEQPSRFYDEYSYFHHQIKNTSNRLGLDSLEFLRSLEEGLL